MGKGRMRGDSGPFPVGYVRSRSHRIARSRSRPRAGWRRGCRRSCRNVHPIRQPRAACRRHPRNASGGRSFRRSRAAW
eukprot:scaffold226811_cov30-Tisochrysis_lutea.AAC.1